MTDPGSVCRPASYPPEFLSMKKVPVRSVVAMFCESSFGLLAIAPCGAQYLRIDLTETQMTTLLTRIPEVGEIDPAHWPHRFDASCVSGMVASSCEPFADSRAPRSGSSGEPRGSSNGGSTAGGAGGSSGESTGGSNRENDDGTGTEIRTEIRTQIPIEVAS